jgi:hypothetical protein
MAHTQGLAVIAVDPRYTSRYHLAASPVHPHQARDPARGCRGRDRSPRPRVRPHHPRRPLRCGQVASAARPPPARWKHGPPGPGMGNRVHGRGQPRSRRPPSTGSRTTALQAPTPIIGCGHAWRALGAGERRA